MTGRTRFFALVCSALLTGALAAPARAAESGDTWTLDGVECQLIPTKPQPSLLSPLQAPPIGVLVPCPGVRPGALVSSSGGQCTFNFMWLGSDGARYIGTAGHCIVDAGEEQTWAPGSGQIGRAHV